MPEPLSRSRSAFSSPPLPHEAALDACLSPARGLQPSLDSFKTPGRRPPPRCSVSISTVECTFRPHHSRIDSSARFACPPFREDLRVGFPCALGHPWLVTLPRPIGARCFSELATSGTVGVRLRRSKHLSREQAVRKLCKCVGYPKKYGAIELLLFRCLVRFPNSLPDRHHALLSCTSSSNAAANAGNSAAARRSIPESPSCSRRLAIGKRPIVDSTKLRTARCGARFIVAM